uniref:CCHC-type domain-containing protein n=2 Tax=Cacopsylla melanoneura TaxID=428564 RepID=A0A8D9FEU7_9HEMI
MEAYGKSEHYSDWITTSEVMGSISPSPSRHGSHTTEDQDGFDWRQFALGQLEEMKQLFQEYKASSLDLPTYDPESSYFHPRAWCNMVDIVLQGVPLRGGQLIVCLSKALKGSAAQWLVQIARPDISWNELRDCFLAQYDIETSASTLFTILNGSPKENESYVTYARQCLTNVEACIANMSTEQIAVNLTLANLAKFNPQIRHLAFTKEISSREELIQELSAISSKTPGAPKTEESPRKKTKYITSAHRATVSSRKECSTSSSKEWTPSEELASSLHNRPFRRPARADITCFKCKSKGHYSYQCRMKHK